jgi:hypothetical protein
MGLKTEGDILLSDYLRHTYRVEDSEVFKEFKRHLTAAEQRKLRVHITVIGGTKAVILTEEPEKLTKVFVAGRGRRPLLFKRCRA